MSDILINQTTRHSLFVQRFAGHLANLFNDRIEQLRKEIRFLLVSADNLTNQKRIDALLKQVEQAQKIVYSTYNKDILDQLKPFAINEAKFEIESLNNALLTDVKLSLPASAQVWAAVTSSPLVFEASNTVVLLKSFIDEMEAVEIKRVENAIRTGIVTGRTNQEIALDITGRGKIIDKTVRQKVKAMVRTATNHVSNVASLSSLMANDDIIKGYKLAVTFDGRTSATCRSYGELDKTYLLTDKYKPLPPFHINCRTYHYAVLFPEYEIDNSEFTRASKGSSGGKQIKADQTYYSWLKNQSAEFQDNAIGRTRGKLLRNGGLTSKQFGELNVDELFRPMTLDEMYQSNPLAFKKANIDPPI